MILSLKSLKAKGILIIFPLMLFVLNIQAQTNVKSNIGEILKLESQMQSKGELLSSLQIKKPTVLADLQDQSADKIQQTTSKWKSSNPSEVASFIKEIEAKIKATTSSVNTTSITQDQAQLLHLYGQELRFLKQKLNK